MKCTKKNVLVATFAVLALIATAAYADSGSTKELPMSASAKAKAKAGGGHKVDVIVQFQRGASAADRANASAMGELKRKYNKLDMVAMSVTEGRLESLAKQPGVRFVSLDQPVMGASESARQTANTPPIMSEYDNLYNGTGQTLAVIDSGVGSHVDIPLVHQKDFVTRTNYTAKDFDWDDFGHGTHVAGIATGLGYASQYAHWGQAYASQVVSLRVLDDTGQGEESAVIAALDWLLANGSTYGVSVVNMSLGKGVDVAAANDPLVVAAEAVWDAGMVVVVSAGNYGRYGNGTVTSPGISRKLITVGSITDSGTGTDFTDDYVSSYSSKGPTRYDNVLKPDLLAPGNRVVAAMSGEATMKADLPTRLAACPPSYGSIDTPDVSYCLADYYEMSGTSMAAPMVAGTALRMLSRDPSLTPATVKARLMKSARKVSGDLHGVGAGVLDITAALDATGTATSALSPVVIPASDGSGMFIEDTSALWGGAEWDAAFLFSDAFVFADGFVFSDVFVFSDAFPFADAFLFSDASIWSDAFLFSDSFVFSDAFMFADRVTLSDPEDVLFLAGQSETINDDLGTSPTAPALSDR